jgi:hypothetical protein
VAERKRLSDILHGGERERLARSWDSTQAAGELGPLPAGEYTVRCLSGELFTSKNSTPGYKLTLEVAGGEYCGRRCWHDFWLTDAALPMAKRDLAKVGITSPEQLDQPLPPGILLRVRLSLRRDDDGGERNRVVRIDAAGVEPGDAFAPAPGSLPPDATTFDPKTFDAGDAERSDGLPPAPPPAHEGNGQRPSTPDLPAGGASSRRRGRKKQEPRLLPDGDGGAGRGPYGEGR